MLFLILAVVCYELIKNRWTLLIFLVVSSLSWPKLWTSLSWNRRTFDCSCTIPMFCVSLGSAGWVWVRFGFLSGKLTFSVNSGLFPWRLIYLSYQTMGLFELFNQLRLNVQPVTFFKTPWLSCRILFNLLLAPIKQIKFPDPLVLGQ